jgi:methionyl-tRNA synthetase
VLAKEPAQRRRLEVVLYELLDSLRLLALTTAPIMPRAAQELWHRLGLEDDVTERRYDSDLVWGMLPAGLKIEIGAPLFPRIEDDKSSEEDKTE